MSWDTLKIQTDEGEREGIAPLIISASRSTDLPAFYADWFINRLRKGYIKWINPFNRSATYVSFSKAKFIVFWTKNPDPLVKYLPEIDARGIRYYFHFTVNDYADERLEPNLPPLAQRIETFKNLSLKIGKEKVIWRYDPLILTDKIDLERLAAKIRNVGQALFQYTQKLVFSFVDIGIYLKVRDNLKRAKINFREFDHAAMQAIAKRMAEMNRDWRLELATCGERILLKEFGIKKNKCIDDALILKMAGDDPELRKLFQPTDSSQLEMFEAKEEDPIGPLKDKGQRPECGCVASKDIGQYNTCGHLCLYCYANHSAKVVERNLKKASIENPSII